MRLIEKIIDYLFEDNTNILILSSFGFLAFLILLRTLDDAHNSKLENEVKLAKIAAGQVVEVDHVQGRR